MAKNNDSDYSTNSIHNVESLIIELRNQKVILDSDVATIYKVETRAINQAVKRNLDKFPQGYIFALSQKEWHALRSQNVTSLTQKGSASLESQNVIPKGGKVKPPNAFTEKGLYMLATILKSKQATQATLQIIETFSKVKEFSRVAKSLATEKNKTQQKTLVSKSGELIGEILNQEFANDTRSETTIELNLAMIKIKHTIKKGT